MVILNDLSKRPKFHRSGTWCFWQKSKITARGHKEIVTYEEFSIYPFIIPLFHLNFDGKFIPGLLFKFESLNRVLRAKSKNGRLIQY